jgi:hypothetical protein
MILVETVIGSSYLEKSDAATSFNWNNHFTRLNKARLYNYFLKLLNFSVGLVGKVKDAEFTTLFPLR